jgi:protein tyrosine phosphatase (PTP) superfamily phosphohydrolase (DUF442 family)
MAFDGPEELTYNEGPIADPGAFAHQHSAASWLFLCGPAFAEVDGGMSFADVEAAVPVAANVVSDPPVPLTMELAREQLRELDSLPRPALVTCRTGPRSSALVYLWSGLHDGATAEEVLARAEAAGAPFTRSDELRAWVTQGLAELG